MLNPSLVLGTVSVLALFGSVPGQQVQPVNLNVLAAFDVAKGSIQDLTLRPLARGTFEVDILLEGVVRKIRFWPHEIRAKGFQLLVDDGVRLQQVPTPASVTYRGTVIGLPDSLVAASIVNGDVDAIVRLSSTGTLHGVQAVRSVIPTAPAGRYLVYDGRDSTAKGHCGVNAGVTPGAGIDSAGNMLCEIACDADWEFYLKNGSNPTNTQNDVTGVMNKVDVIYKRDVQIQYKITTIIVRTTRVYTTTDASSLLGQFRNRWNSRHGSVRRDVAHLFTGKGLNGGTIGIAALRVICNLSQAYGLSESRFSSNATRRAGLTAHELGHNWGAGHCSGSGCYIMCPGLGGCGRDLTRFNSGSRNSIINHKNSRSCLTPASPPVLTALTPNSAQAFGGEKVILTGTDLSGVTRVNVGFKQVLPPQLRVLSNTSLEVTVPVPIAIGASWMTAVGAVSTSNALVFNYTTTSPPQHAVSSIGLGGFPLSYRFGGKPRGNWFVLISFRGQATVPVLGVNILANGWVFSNGALDPIGNANWSIVPPVGALVGVTIYSQMIEFNSPLTAIEGGTVPTPTQFVR